MIERNHKIERPHHIVQIDQNRNHTKTSQKLITSNKAVGLAKLADAKNKDENIIEKKTLGLNQRIFFSDCEISSFI